MSRSYRKPYFKSTKRTKKGKQAANRWLRRSQKALGFGKHKLPPTNGCNYKRYYCSWDITDCKYRVCEALWHIYKRK